MSLPRGIGLVRVAFPGRALIVVSPHLTDEEEKAARAIAYALGTMGKRIVVLRETMIAEAAAA